MIKLLYDSCMNKEFNSKIAKGCGEYAERNVGRA